MERSISVSIEVFAKIWSLRENGEDTENQILMRILSTMRHRTTRMSKKEIKNGASNIAPQNSPISERVTWRDDVRLSLERLHGSASLSDIYQEVREVRKAGGRSIPISFEPVVRRTLEENSSDSEVYRGGPDLFRMPEGKGMGVWALR